MAQLHNKNFQKGIPVWGDSIRVHEKSALLALSATMLPMQHYTNMIPNMRTSSPCMKAVHNSCGQYSPCKRAEPIEYYERNRQTWWSTSNKCIETCLTARIERHRESLTGNPVQQWLLKPSEKDKLGTNHHRPRTPSCNIYTLRRNNR
jgi:hypothetical protein